MSTTKRVQQSYGTCYFQDGISSPVNRGRFVLDRTRKFYLFDIIPCAKPRMTQRDKFYTDPNHKDPKKRQRLPVTKYLEFKARFQEQAAKMNYELGDTLEAVYFIPMPDSWSAKKKERMNGLPHKQTPDTDNITKAVKDALLKNDSVVWCEKAENRWAYMGSIIIFG